MVRLPIRAAGTDPVTTPTFYTVSNAAYFPGTVALLNSLRLTGNEGELVVLDVDLEPFQRELLRSHVRLVQVPQEVAINPLLLKAFPATLDPEGVVVVIDSDIIVTGDLSAAVDEAQRGAICVYPDTRPDRWFAEWSTEFGLQAALRRQPYVNSGFVAFSVDSWPWLLSRWRSLSEGIPSPSTRAGGAPKETPLWDGDQDALNAILMSEVPADALCLLPVEEAPTAFADRHQVDVVDVTRLACTFRGRRSVFLHTSGVPKPWQANGWLPRIWRDGYVRLLPRVLFGEDVPLRLDAAVAPLWLRPGRLARFAARRLDVAHLFLRPVPPRVRRTAAAALHRLVA